MFNISEELKKLPAKAGVYIMRDKNNNIIYVGKAVSLKNRVKQYFMKGNKGARIEKMVSLIDHFEYIVKDNEAEALILECNLIKKNLPKFNVLLKDDKTYPYIRVDIKSDYPSIFMTRTLKKDGAKYFGPYASAGSAKEMMRFAKERFKIRQCKKFKSNKRACLNYHINNCSAPCMGYITKEEYHKQIEQIMALLEGKIDTIIKQMDSEIVDLSRKQEYEKAAEIRDRKNAIIQISEKQKVSNINENSIDVIGLAKNELSFCVEIFFVRGSKMVDREHYFFDNVSDMSSKELLSSFIKQYYFNKVEIPSRIMIEEEIDDLELIEDILTDSVGAGFHIRPSKIQFKIPKKGEKLRFIEMAKTNSKIALDNRTKEKEDILNSLKESLSLNILPRKIECFDISHISGDFIVGGMIVAKDGVINKASSRRFKIKTLFSRG